MRLRLLRRRLTISAPRMAVRSALPWPFRWAALALVLGFCAAIGLWAFEFGKDIAGIDGGAREALVQARAELAVLRSELAQAQEARDKAQSVANTAGTLLTSEKSAQERLLAQIRQLESENHALRDDLGFFEKLIPASAGDGLGIRGMQAELLGGGVLKWQVLVIQSSKHAPEFNGQLDIIFAGLLHGKPWSATLPAGQTAIQVRQYRRFEGEYTVPAQVVLRSVSARVLDGPVVKASHTVTL